jgi:nitrite reductase (NADH) large subunit
MRAVIVGSGLAGTIAAKTLRELDAGVEIEIFGEEKYPYYPRPNLIEFLAGRLPFERLFAFPADWGSRQRIEVRSGLTIGRIRPAEKTVETADGASVPYDVLLLANGSRAFVPPLRGSGLKGVYVLRTIDDARAILDRLKGRPRAAVVGGGLLGIEIAGALKAAGAEVGVVEIADRLLPRHLDPAGAVLLQRQVEKAGIELRLATATEEILGEGEATGLRFQGGGRMQAETVVIAAGIRPEVEAARAAGLVVRSGVVVDDRLRSNADGIFAAGDVAEHRGSVYGIIPAAFEQARAAAFNMLGMDMPYSGTAPASTLKVAGTSVTSVGVVMPDGPGYEILTRSRPEENIYKKIILKDGLLVGAIWMGTRKGAAEISRLVAGNKNVDRRKEDLLEETLDWSEVEIS